MYLCALLRVSASACITACAHVCETGLLLVADGRKIADIAGSGANGQQVQPEQHPPGSCKVHSNLPLRCGTAETAPMHSPPTGVVAQQQLSALPAAAHAARSHSKTSFDLLGSRSTWHRKKKVASGMLEPGFSPKKLNLVRI